MGIEPLRMEREATGECAGCVTIWLEQPGKPVVVLDEILIRRLNATLDAVARDARAVIIASASDRVFVAGADLKAIQDPDDARLQRYLEFGAEVFGRISELPCPTAAAIGGAALGGGLELAMHCDGLIGAPGPKPYPIGLPETGLKICPGWGGTNLLPARIDAERAIRCTATGQTLMDADAAGAGLFDAVASGPANLLETARRWACAQRAPARDGAPSRWIGRAGRSSAALAALNACREEVGQTPWGRAVCDAIDAGLARGWSAATQAERDHLVRLRAAPAGREAIEAFFDRASAKR
ncbi:MAG: enoyl-CoA hydratase/isomerase family protein [Phycisphaeraceae bacterium]|nr:enoyl-CoA hydratase/isomerase family protein [Phycisphaeraceae bacterium]